MKKIICESCGSVDLVYQDGSLVCRSCGTRYVITGIMTPEKMKNLYTLARRAFEEGIFDDAAEYYGDLLEENPDDWEAYSFGRMARLIRVKEDDLSDEIEIFNDLIEKMLKMIRQSSDDPDTLIDRINKVHDGIITTSHQIFYRLINLPDPEYDPDNDYKLDIYYAHQDKVDKAKSDTYMMLLKWEEETKKQFKGSDVTITEEMFIDNYKERIRQLYAMAMRPDFDAKKEIRRLTKIIKKYEPDWKIN